MTNVPPPLKNETETLDEVKGGRGKVEQNDRAEKKKREKEISGR